MTNIERSIIPIIGKPGSGKSHLGRELEKSLLIDGHNVEHISVGGRIRKIGDRSVRSFYEEYVDLSLTLQPNELLDDDLVERVAREAIDGAFDTDLLIIDGMPRTATQVGTLSELAWAAHRAIAGVIVTDIDDEEALLRQLKRAGRDTTTPVDPQAIARRAQIHQQNFPDVIGTYHTQYPELTVATIVTCDTKSETIERGREVVDRMLGIQEF